MIERDWKTAGERDRERLEDSRRERETARLQERENEMEVLLNNRKIRRERCRDPASPDTPHAGFMYKTRDILP